jgi:hypothetical protein
VPVLAAAVCPHPPLLVPQVAAGASAELDGLRTACLKAVSQLIDLEPDVVVVVGDSPTPMEADETAVGSLAGFGIDVKVGPASGTNPSGASLPLALVIGSWLLDQAGWTGRRRLIGVPDTTGSAEAGVIGAALAHGTDRITVLVMGDGSARLSTSAPGYLDSRAALFDATVASALATANGAALLALEPALAIELLAAGRASWQVLGGLIEAATLANGRPWSGDLLADIAPYGVGYIVATAFPEPAAG